MKTYRRAVYCIVLSSLFINFISLPSSSAANKTQLFKPSKAGRISTVIANTILNGVTPPKASEGKDGDFYIDTRAMLFYGPKAKSRWPSPTSIRGPQGQAGSNGTVAKPAANVIATSAQGLTGSTGPKGEQGVQGVAGSAGPKGETGSAGPAGASGLAGAGGAGGAQGAQGSPGAQGAQGSPGTQGAQGSLGIQGAPGSQGPQGSPGTNGAVGPSGPTGAAGADGSSNAIYGAVDFVSPIQGVVGTAQTSSNFGTFQAGKSYVVRIQIQTFNVDRLIATYPLALELSALGAAPSRSISYVVSNGSSFNLSVRRDEVSITVEVILDGSQVVSSYALSLTVTCGANTTSFPVTLMGRYHATQVGQVTQTS
jgi:hypothetical protein